MSQLLVIGMLPLHSPLSSLNQSPSLPLELELQALSAQEDLSDYGNESSLEKLSELC